MCLLLKKRAIIYKIIARENLKKNIGAKTGIPGSERWFLGFKDSKIQ